MAGGRRLWESAPSSVCLSVLSQTVSPLLIKSAGFFTQFFNKSMIRKIAKEAAVMFDFSCVN